MKKVFILAVALLMVGSAFAASPAMNASRLFVQPNATFGQGNPATTNNDDSCDIAVTPAATLLLPYFEVDYAGAPATAVNTLFTITNTSAVPQIAHLTVWTDWSYPVLDFNIYLTGYDVQGISLYDLISRGIIPATGYDISNEGDLSDDNSDNPNWDGAATDSGSAGCASLPGPIPNSLLSQIQSALTTGVYSGACGTTKVGGAHSNAIGYITVDVVDQCSQLLPIDYAYYNTLLYDNVLIGDWQRVNPNPATTGSTAGNYAGGNPMVHIRAMPEGGPLVNGPDRTDGAALSNFPNTFYERYVDSVVGPGNATLPWNADRRQPLPSVWAARYLDNVASTDAPFGTTFIMWREGVTGAAASCSAYKSNASLSIERLVRFDEQENPTLPQGCQISPCPGEGTFDSPETSNRNVGDSDYFPADFAGTNDDGGWMYMDLIHNDTYGEWNAQSWVTIEMTSEGRYGVDFDAAYLGNGCSTGAVDEFYGGSAGIGPLENNSPLVLKK